MHLSNEKFNVFGVLISLLIFIGVVIITSFAPISVTDSSPDPDGKDLWTYITEENSYTNWDHWPGLDDMYEGQSPHGAFLKLYVNEVAKDALENGSSMMPEGAIIVKENYNKKKKLAAVTPMYKVDGYNSDANDWFWAKYKKNGQVLVEGKVQSCIDCHADVKNDDYLFTISKMEEETGY